MDTTLNTAVAFPPLPAPKLDWAGNFALQSMRLALQISGRLAPSASADYIYNLYFSPKRYPVPEREKKILKTASSFDVPFTSLGNVRYPGGNLKAWSWGQGPVVLVVHGWESRGVWLTEPFLGALLAANFKVVTLDLAGHGQSPGTQAEVLDFANAIQSVARVCGPIHGVIAHSLGAAATTIALTQGLSANKVVYLGPACWMEAFPRRVTELLRLPASCKTMLFDKLYQVYSAEQWRYYSGDVISKELTLPGLIIHDKQDAEVHHEGAIAIHNVWANSQLVLTDGLGHRRIIRDPSVVKQTLQFLV